MISNKYQFIFVHAPRTGGSSFERAVGQDITLDSRTNNLGNTDFYEKHKSFEYYHQTYPNEFINFFKFTIVRNPFDRLVSQWLWRTTVIKDYQGTNLKDFITSRKKKSALSEKYKLSGFSVHDSIARFNYIGRFEDLHNTYKYLFNKLNIQQNEVIHSNQTVHTNYRDYYCDETIQLVNTIYGDDLQLFNYKF